MNRVKLERVTRMTTTDRIDTIVARARHEFEARFEPVSDELGNIARANGLAHLDKNISAAFAQLRNEKLRLLVMGRFNNGKSTLINALLASTMHKDPQLADCRILPMERIPSTPALTRIVYGETFGLTAHMVDGSTQELTLDAFQKLARLYGETTDSDGFVAENKAIEDIRWFELRLPHPLLALGLELGDTPGLLEDPRRSATTRAACLDADGAIVVFRSDTGVGLDERNAVEDILAMAGQVFPLVNTFAGEFPCDREKTVFMSKLASLRSGPDGSKLDPETHWVDARGALLAQEQGNADRLAASRLPEFERAIGEFLVTKAYGTKKRAAVDKVCVNGRILEAGLHRLRSATMAERETLLAVIETCQRDIQAMQDQRDRVHHILQRLREDVEAVSRASFQKKCAELQLSIDGLFAKQKLASFETIGGKLSELVNGKISREAQEALGAIVRDSFETWATSQEDRPGLLRDLAPSFEIARAGLEREMRDFAARLHDISLRLNAIPEMTDSGSVLPVGDRLAGAAIGTLFLGPVLGPLYATTGWRGVIGSMVAASGVKSAAVIVSSALGISLAAPWVLAVLAGALLLGGVSGGLYELENRVRRAALEKIRPTIQALASDEAVIEEIRSGLVTALDREAALILDGLDNVLADQRQTLEAMLQANEATLAEREKTRAEIEAALARVQHLIAELVKLSNASPDEPALAAPAAA